MKAFSITNGIITPNPVSAIRDAVSVFPWRDPAISANGTNNAIAWIINLPPTPAAVPAVLHAFNATNLAQQLYSCSQNLTRDNPGGAVKMTTAHHRRRKSVCRRPVSRFPFTASRVFLEPPTISPPGRLVHQLGYGVACPIPLRAHRFIIRWTAPRLRTASLLYTGPFILTTNAVVKAIASRPGAVSSGMSSVSFVNAAACG